MKSFTIRHEMTDHEVSRYSLAVPVGATVTVTDPTYSVGEGVELALPPGRYLFVSVLTGRHDEWGMKVKTLMMVQKTEYEENVDYILSSRAIGKISVDSGHCGFFVNKPNLTGEELSEIGARLALMDKPHRCAMPDLMSGFFTSSGYGNGIYDVLWVYLRGKRVGVAIEFIPDVEIWEEFDE